jgi:hypothetical protein
MHRDGHRHERRQWLDAERHCELEHERHREFWLSNLLTLR